jgi:hypothetical protein
MNIRTTDVSAVKALEPSLELQNSFIISQAGMTTTNQITHSLNTTHILKPSASTNVSVTSV